MRILANIANVTAPSSDYPKGRVRNKNNAVAPPVIGTPIVEEIFGDIVQYFQKLVIDAGITENDLPDNVTNGLQLIAALKYCLYNGYVQNASTTLKGISRLADLNEVRFAGNEDIVTSQNLQIKDGGLNTVAIDFPTNWNMVSDGSKNIDLSAYYPFTISGLVRMVKDVRVNIYNNASTQIIPLDFNSAGWWRFDMSTETVEMARVDDKDFDAATFNNASGCIIIEFYADQVTL